jgi:hypothetical protein
MMKHENPPPLPTPLPALPPATSLTRPARMQAGTTPSAPATAPRPTPPLASARSPSAAAAPRTCACSRRRSRSLATRTTRSRARPPSRTCEDLRGGKRARAKDASAREECRWRASTRRERERRRLLAFPARSLASAVGSSRPLVGVGCRPLAPSPPPNSSSRSLHSSSPGTTPSASP